MADAAEAPGGGGRPRLAVLDLSKPQRFTRPVKTINEGRDVNRFLTSRAYADIGTFVMQLNTAMCPRKLGGGGEVKVKTWELGGSEPIHSGLVSQLQQLLKTIEAIIDEAPPDTGPRRFGNVSFRTWHSLLESRISGLLREYVPAALLDVGGGGAQGEEGVTAEEELASYLLGGFGSAQRLDFGTGHELSFLAFLGGLWKLGGFTTGNEVADDDGGVERSIVLGVFEP